ncbi:MAG: hypothetical protein K8R39_03165 [Arcobacteraceae bacterium]|nr:hypothetical protein [Arcobacteraceae bacterium]
MKKENISILISTISLLIAAFAIWLPFYQNKLKEKEILQIDINLDKNSKIQYLNEKVLQFPFIVTISNNSLVSLSIVDYYFSQFDNNREGYVFDGIDGKILPIDNKVVKFPIFLESGKSIKFKVLVGYRFSLDNKNILKMNIIDLANKNLLNIFGFASLEEKNDNIPIYLMSTTTGRGNTFFKDFALASIYTTLTEKDIEKFSSQLGVHYLDLNPKQLTKQMEFKENKKILIRK